MKTRRALSRSSKCANKRHHKNEVFYSLPLIHNQNFKTKKTQHTIVETFTEKNALQNLTRFHVRLFSQQLFQAKNEKKSSNNLFAFTVYIGKIIENIFGKT